MLYGNHFVLTKAKTTITLAFLAIYLLCKFDEASCKLFQDLDHLNDFETVSYGGHFTFQNEAKTFCS